jgi:predicted nucleic acid-binding protein
MRPAEESRTVALLEGLVVFPVTRAIAETAGRLKRRARGRAVELTDCLIAATALIEGAALATGNVKHYPMPELTLLPAPR